MLCVHTCFGIAGWHVLCICYTCLISSGLQVTEEQLATVFQECGSVIDCRVCGDPNSAMKFAFIEFLEEAAVKMVSFLH